MRLQQFGMLCAVLLLGRVPLAEGGAGAVLLDGPYDPQARIVLGRIDAVTTAGGAGSVVQMEWRLTVLLEWRERIRAGESVVVVVQETTAPSDSIGKWKKGDVVLVTAQLTASPGKLVYTPNTIAVGVFKGRHVVEHEVDLVMQALQEMRRVHEGLRGRDEIRRRGRELMKSRNYYLWALGASLWAEEIGDYGDLLVLERLYDDREVPLREIVWTDWLLGRIKPERFRPDRVKRLDLLDQYLLRRFAELPLLPEPRQERRRPPDIQTRPTNESVDRY